jgi:hydrogenase nickel incorporation protein HypA/HybF
MTALANDSQKREKTIVTRNRHKSHKIKVREGGRALHEMSVCESVIQILNREAERHQFTRVKTVRIELGARSGVTPEAIDFCFRRMTKGTLADGARLELLREPLVAWCMNCGDLVSIKERYDACPQCRSYELQIGGTDTLRVTALEVE